MLSPNLQNTMMRIFIVLLLATIYFPMQAQQKDSTATYVEKMPTFPGGTEEMYRYVYHNLHYPEVAKFKKISGQVITQFVVDERGEIRDVKVIRGIGYGCDEEAKRLIESMNNGYKWDPGMHNGRPVPVTFTLPIKFFLQ
jgi:protein TonB